ncbi:MAG: zf-HC2 domain-containing protein [bacterium]|nr:zf-HC2 domain-containing protein [bacterium]
MLCKTIFNKLSEYIDRELDSSICDKIDKHIAECKPCQAFINTFRKTVNLLRARQTDQIPPDTHARLHQQLNKYLYKKG